MEEHRGINHSIYSNYLNEHLLGSEGGVNAFKAAADTWRGTEHEGAFKSLAQQVKADQDDLHRIIRDLGYDHAPLRSALTIGVRLAGRINPVNLLRRRKAGMAQVELDTLTGLLRAKLSMWETLLLLHSRDPRLDAALLTDLQRRAEEQVNQVRDIIAASCEERFFTV